MTDNVIPFGQEWREDWEELYDAWPDLPDDERCEDPPTGPYAAPPEPPGFEKQLAWLGTIVGGEAALHTLTDAPLVPQGLDLTGVRPELQDRVARVVDAAEVILEPAIGVEAVAVARLLLPRAVRAVPGLMSSDRDDILTGALVHAVAQGNDLLGPNRPLPGRVVMTLCGLRSSPSLRGQAIVRALGVGWSPGGYTDSWVYACRPDVWPLGSPDLLVSGFRRSLMRMRDVALTLRVRVG